MKGRDEIIVGATMLLALAIVAVGAVWMSQNQFGQAGSIQSARFLTVGGLQVGNPVVLRGVRVGRVERIELSEGDWVVASLQIYPAFGEGLPENPAVIAASASLFGEWQAGIIDFEDEIDDPNVRRDLDLAADGSGVWPGATLPRRLSSSPWWRGCWLCHVSLSCRGGALCRRRPPRCRPRSTGARGRAYTATTHGW